MAGSDRRRISLSTRPPRLSGPLQPGLPAPGDARRSPVGRRWQATAAQSMAAALQGLLVSLLLVLLHAGPAVASPGLCVGPVCGDAFTRSAKHVFQLRLRLSDQSGHHERITVDCRDGRISPALGPVDRGYGSAVARRACRLASRDSA